MSWTIGWVNSFNQKTSIFSEEREIGGKVSATKNDSGFLNAVAVNQYWVSSHARRLVCVGE